MDETEETEKSLFIRHGYKCPSGDLRKVAHFSPPG